MRWSGWANLLDKKCCISSLIYELFSLFPFWMGKATPSVIRLHGKSQRCVSYSLSRLFFLTFYIIGELRLHKRCHWLSLWYDNGQKHCGAKANTRDIYKSFIFNLICTIRNSKHLQNPPSDAPLYCIYASIINYAVHFIAFTTTAFSLYFMLRISMPCFYLHVKCLRWFV